MKFKLNKTKLNLKNWNKFNWIKQYLSKGNEMKLKFENIKWN